VNIAGGNNGDGAGTVLDAANLGVTSIYQQTHWNNVINSQEGATGIKGTYTSPLGDVAGGGSVAAGGSFLDSSNSAVSNFTVIWAGIGAANSWTETGAVAPVDSGPLSAGVTAANNLYYGRAYVGTNANTTFEFQNIPYATYSIVVYGDQSTAGVTSNSGVTGYDGTTGLPTGGTPVDQGTYQLDKLSSWTEATSATAGNYFVLSGLTGANQALTFLRTGTTELHIEAFQVVDNGGTAVPEPASLSLLGLGGLALIRRRRSAK
jgi:hypothetical protein